ncbi:hypothetical protein IFM89_020802 [Coptis chinensis]|uniref:Protein NRDE2 homolog n=1 Tax=Coptis chinensis TaxID=261450 RepID=A0A835IW62_9MAGN|nr:hypothetical protein IFM89_020802 [Coptis chinensis]
MLKSRRARQVEMEAKQNEEEAEGEKLSPSSKQPSSSSSFLFPLLNPSSQHESREKQSQWLSNTSFTIDLSIVNQSISSQYEDEYEDDELEQEEEEVVPLSSNQTYSLLNSSSSSEEEDKRRKKKKKSKHKRKRERVESSDYFNYNASSRKRGVKAWEEDLDTKPSKDYYFDSRGDRDNLAFGSLYRMDVARYKPLKPSELCGLHFQSLYKRKNWDSLWDGDQDTDVLDDKLRSGGRIKFQVSSHRKPLGCRRLEKKISILEKATELNPDNEDLLLSLMKAYQSRDNREVLIERWEKILVQHSGNYMLWREFLRVIQGDFSRFKVSEVRKMYAHAIEALSAACGRLSRQGHQTAKLGRDIIQVELGLVDTFVSLCRFEWQSGYQELATALFQAEIEFSLFSPSLLLTEQSKLRLFEHFWNENGSRVGEDGALGWSVWLEKEEENRQKVIIEDSIQESQGGWTGWSEPPLVKDETGRKAEGLMDGVAVGNGVEENLEDEAIQQDDDVELLLRKMGIDVDKEAECEVKDTAVWTRWSEEELSRDSGQWMPILRKICSPVPGGLEDYLTLALSSLVPDDPPDREGEEQILRVILFEDISEFLFSLSCEEARLSLVSQFIDFFGGKFSRWVCTNNSSWMAKILSLETLSDSILDDIRKINESTQAQSNSNGFNLTCLLGNSLDITSRTNMMKFLRNTICLCLTAFPRNYILEEAALVSEELYMTKMNSFTCSATPSRTLAKRLLKNDRQDLLLCGVYAQTEAAFGNLDLARKVFDMALSSITDLPSDLQSNISLLYLWYAEMELSNCSDEGLESSSLRAVHILSCLGSGDKYSVFKCQPSSPQLLRARQGFKEQIRTLRATWARGDIKDESVALICAASLFEDLTSGEASGVGVIEEAFSMVLPGRRSQSSQLEFLFNYYIKRLQKHYERLKPSRVFQSILQGLQIYPYNPKLLAAFIEIGCLYTVPNKLRLIFDEFCHTKPSVILWLFALSYELGKEGSRHRIHALFERAVADDRLQDCVILWRCYLAYEADVACNLSAARRIFFRAINACPWSKKLWLDGFLKLNSILTAKEMSDLQEVMRDKELNLRTDIYEILLQDEIKP